MECASLRLANRSRAPVAPAVDGASALAGYSAGAAGAGAGAEGEEVHLDPHDHHAHGVYNPATFGVSIRERRAMFENLAKGGTS